MAAMNPEVQRMLEQAMRQLDGLTTIQESLQEVRGEGQAADGMVNAEVNPSGVLTSININPRAMRLGSEALAEAIVEATRTAQEDARNKAREIVAPLAEQSAIMRSVLNSEKPKIPDNLRDLTVDMSAATDPVAGAIEQLRKFQSLF